MDTPKPESTPTTESTSASESASTQLTLKGTVLDQGSGKRLKGATLRLETPNGPLLAESDKDGNFAFPPFDEPDLAVGENEYQILLYAYYTEGRQQEPIPYKLKIDKGRTSEYVRVEMVNRGPINNRAGKIFLGSLVLLLAASAILYWQLHTPKGTEDQEVPDHYIVKVLTESLDERITADSITVSTFIVEDTDISPEDSLLALSELEQIRDVANELYNASQLNSSLQALVNESLLDVQQAIENRNKDAILTALSSTRASLSKLPSLENSWFWSTTPLVYIEVFFWALFATFIRLIGNTSYYVSRNNFLGDSIWHKAPLLVTMPLVTLLIVIVISFFKIVFTIGGTSFTVDFSNPFISIILASLIGLAPWKAYEFMYGLADLLFNQLKKWLGLNKSGDEKSEKEETSSKSSDDSGDAPDAKTPTVKENPSGATDTTTEDTSTETTTETGGDNDDTTTTSDDDTSTTTDDSDPPAKP